MTTTPPLKFAISGAGVIGSVHAEAIEALPDAELVAVADAIPALAENLAGKYGVRAYGDLGEMLAREEIDVVNICTPSGMHGAQAIMVMRSGRHVIVEKPMEITLPGIDAMLQAQRDTGVKLAVISQRRFDPATQEVYKLVQDGALGTLVMGNAHVLWWRSQAYYDSGAWRGTWALDGGGVLMNQSIHSIDVLQWLMGPVRSVQAYTDTRAHTMETEDVAVAVLRFVSGAVGTIAATTSAYPGVAARIEICGDRGSAIIENDQLAYRHLASEDIEEPSAYGSIASSREQKSPDGESTAHNPAAVSTSGHGAQIVDMIEAIRDNRAPLVDGIAGKHPVQIILAIYESAGLGREVIIE